jgi:hypothetical protein
MKKEIILTVVVFLVAASGGFLLGRKFPVHNYQPWRGGLLYDTTTGGVCSPLKTNQEAASANQNDPSVNPLEELLKARTDKTNTDPYPPCN